MWIILWGLILVFALFAVVYFRRRTYLIQYLFFVRYPLLAGAFLVLLPWVGPKLVPTMLSNIFVMGWIGTITVTFVTCLTIWSIMYVFWLTWKSVPYRCGLGFYREPGSTGSVMQAMQSAPTGQVSAATAGAVLILVADRMAIFALLLGVPLAIRIVFHADGPAYYNVLAIFAGVALAWFVRWLTAFLAAVRRRARGTSAVVATPPPARVWQLDYFLEGLPPELRGAHHRALRYLWVALGVYFLLGFLAWPNLPDLFAADFLSVWLRDPARIPALAILLAVVMLFVWLMGALAFLVDRERIPLIPGLIVVLLLWQWLWPTNHEFRVTPWTKIALPKDSTELLDQWCRSRPGKPLAAIACSGGGIRASLWTAQVLSGLESVPGFHQDVAIVSSVSGGSLGAFYYLDGFAGMTTCAGRDRLVEVAGKSSLMASVWGMCYPDLVRIATGSMLNPYDRGWAQERAWSQNAVAPDVTFATWSEALSKNELPLPIFNATLHETGQRLLASPARLPVNDPRVSGRRDLFTYVPGFQFDMPILTAVRLSASFPFISPLTRPGVPDKYQRFAPHAADGGYYDNSGLMSCLTALDDYLRSNAPSKPKRLAIIEIRASAPADTAGGSLSQPTGIWDNLTGPLVTMFNVEDNSQVARTAWEMSLVLDQWTQRKYCQECEHFLFHLSAGLPLSWHLTEAERNEIREHWPTVPIPKVQETDPKHENKVNARRANQRELARLTEFLQRP
ncbi:MAG: patatin-like phospholipase family protein [Pirellulales bacterium]|nr:patatin-like phospholipase family protein [Pirellulales bacterium]